MRELIKELLQGSIQLYEVRDFWAELRIDREIVVRRFREILGNDEQHIRDIDESLKYLRPIIDSLQRKMVNFIERYNSKMVAVELYKAFDKCFRLYMKEKDDRKRLTNQNTVVAEVSDVYENNRYIAMSIIAASNIWLENCVLLQKSLDKKYEATTNDVIDPILVVDLYIYGAISSAISLLSLSKNYQYGKLYYGIDIDPESTNPIVVYREHPVIYHSPLINGNQEVFFVNSEDYLKADNSAFGTGFFDQYGVPFIGSLRVLLSFQKNELQEGKHICIAMNKERFENAVEWYGQGVIDKEKFWNTFVLTKEKLQNSKRENDPIIWKMGVNKERHELRPFLYFDDNTVFVTYAALEQAKHIWLSYFANGGIAYTNCSDKFTSAEEIRCKELADILVDQLKDILIEKYEDSVVHIDVAYQKIFGEKDEDYGDYDVVCYTNKTKELFLIEAKYFSDSLNISGHINDYEKLFSNRGYYFHCRKRYDLVLSESEKIKRFIGADNEKIKVHMLFVPSKPLEIEVQDSDQIVSFVPLAIFKDYLDSKLISEDGSTVIRPVKEI